MSDGRFGYVPNLHVILDGENRARAGTYLPIGIELVRKLIRQGRYANSKTIAIDDAVITAKVIGEQRWLRIWVGGRCELYLESGIVNVGSIGPANPAFNDNGKLYTSPALDAMPELNGLLALPLTTEAPPKPASGDVAESFKKKVTVDVNGNETVDQASLSELQRKKLTVALVPPSLFTGKTRLYVQAIYGRRLKHFKQWSMNLDFQPAALRYTSRRDGAEYVVDIYTNSGIYTTEDYRYFLLRVEGGSEQYITVRELMAESACVEAARAYLVKNEERLTEAKKMALEAYILSGSYPSNDITFRLDAVIPTTGALGYGWHFNWSGTACDIVQVNTIDLGGGLYEHESAHHRMEFSRDKDKPIPVSEPSLTPAQQERIRWAAIKQAVVETKKWKNSKWQQVIAYPDWSASKLQIFGQLWGSRFGAGAPLYCFYRKDELQMVRFSLSGGESKVESECTSEPSWFMGVRARGPSSGFPCGAYANVGDHASTAEIKEYTETPTTAAFDCNGNTVGTTTQSYAFSRYSRSSLTIETKAALGGSGGYIGSGDTGTFNSGAPDVTTSVNGCYVSHTSAQSTVGGPFSWVEHTINVDYSVETLSGSHSESGNLLFVVPFYDAEAVYLYGNISVNEQGIGTTGNRHHDGDFFGIPGIRRYALSTGQIFDAPYYTDTLYSSGPNAWSKDATSTAPLGFYLINAEQVHALIGDPPSLNAFFAGEPNTHVEQTFSTYTSAVLAATRGQNLALTGGYAQDGHVFVGHA